MLDKSTMVQVTNRDKGSVGYIIPDLGNLNRQYQPGETKEVTFEELEKLSWIPGGNYILKNCLVIHNEDAINALIAGGVEPEYYYSEEDVKRLLSSGSLDEFLDCLDFAPVGVLDMIKDLAVTMPLNDVQKRKAILDKLGFDVDTAVMLLESAEENDNEQSDGRRAAKPEVKDEVPTPTRRVVKIIK